MLPLCRTELASVHVIMTTGAPSSCQDGDWAAIVVTAQTFGGHLTVQIPSCWQAVNKDRWHIVLPETVSTVVLGIATSHTKTSINAIFQIGRGPFLS